MTLFLRWMACAVLLIVAAIAWRGYQHPDFAIGLINSTWSCN